MKSKIFFISVLFFAFFGWAEKIKAAVIFEDNFDAQSDWTHQQYNLGQHASGDPGTCLYPANENCSHPANWSGYYDGDSYCAGGPGHNTLNINAVSPRGVSGKSLTFWDESCTNSFEDSDGNLGKVLSQSYDEIYVRYYIKFSTGFKWNPNGAPQHKLAHIQSYCKTGTPWSYFGNSCNMPISVPGIKTYEGDVWYYVAYRCEINYYCQGSPSYGFDVGSDQDHVNLGPWAATLGDGNWHSMEFYFRGRQQWQSVDHRLHRHSMRAVVCYG